MLNPVKLISKLFKSNNQKELDKIHKIVEKVNNFEEKIIKLKDEDFPKKTEEFKKRIKMPVFWGGSFSVEFPLEESDYGFKPSTRYELSMLALSGPIKNIKTKNGDKDTKVRFTHIKGDVFLVTCLKNKDERLASILAKT